MSFQEQIEKIKSLVNAGSYEEAEARFYVAVAENSKHLGNVVGYSKYRPFVDALNNSGLWGHIKGLKPNTDQNRYIQEIVHNKDSLIPRGVGITRENVVEVITESLKKSITDRRQMVDILKEHFSASEIKRNREMYKNFGEDLYALAVGKTWQNIPTKEEKFSATHRTQNPI